MKKQNTLKVCLLSVGLLSSLNASEYEGADEYDSKYRYNKSEKLEERGGLELRANYGIASGSQKTNFEVTNSHGSLIHSETITSDLSSAGYSFLVGYGLESPENGRSGFLYLGFEKQKWTNENDSTNDYTSFLLGAESGVGTKHLKFVYGGEFGIGTIDTDSSTVNSLSTYTAEPFIGLRMTFVDSLSINLRVGAKAYFIDDTVYTDSGYTGTGENHLITGNAQVGIGYSFY